MLCRLFVTPLHFLIILAESCCLAFTFAIVCLLSMRHLPRFGHTRSPQRQRTGRLTVEKQPGRLLCWGWNQQAGEVIALLYAGKVSVVQSHHCCLHGLDLDSGDVRGCCLTSGFPLRFRTLFEDLMCLFCSFFGKLSIEISLRQLDPSLVL